MVLAAAEREGVEIDYLARESACADANGMSPATLTLGSLVTEPVPGTTGGRPPLTETGWLTNGQRSPSTSRGEAMAKRTPWQPPQESARRRHSIFVDVELWDERDGQRTWSCPMLAAVWQLLRLGLLRDQGRPVVTPQDWTDPRFPDDWDDLPAVIRLRPKAAAFAAYTTLSVLSPRFLPVELAVRTILSQFACDEQHPRGSHQPGRARRDARCRTSWSTGSGTCSRPRGKPTPREAGVAVTRRSGARGRRHPTAARTFAQGRGPGPARCQPGPERCPAAAGPR